MKMNKVRKTFANLSIITLVLLQVTFTSIEANSFEDTRAEARANWNSNRIFLRESSPIEQQVTYLNLQYDGKDNVSDYHRFHMTFCWNPTTKNFSRLERCGFVGLTPGWNGDVYRAGFDLTFWHAIDYQERGDAFCEKRELMGKINDVETYYVVCGTSVAIDLGTTYLLKVQSDRDLTRPGEFWWYATIKNLNTGEVKEIGSIRNFDIQTSEPLRTIYDIFMYRAQDTKLNCKAIPRSEILVSLPQSSNGETSSFANFNNGTCVSAKFTRSLSAEGQKITKHRLIWETSLKSQNLFQSNLRGIF